MKTTKFKSIVKKVKSRGTCFIQIPNDFAKEFSEKEEIKVSINSKMDFFSNIRIWRGLGFYVPADIAIKNELFDKEVEIIIEEIEGFYGKILSDGRVYIPQNLAHELKLKAGDIVLLGFELKNEIQKQYCRIHIRKKENTEEYFCMFTRKRSEKLEGIFKVMGVFPYKRAVITSGDIKDSFRFENYAKINENTAIIFHGNRVPILINVDERIENFVHYLGCFFADGTKRGTHWGICASTFEQAIYYKEMHERLIKDAKIVFSISYSDATNKPKEVLKEELIKKWRENTSFQLNEISVRIIPIKNENVPKRNPYGSLIFKENRELTRIYYVRLLNLLLNKIKEERNKESALEFILGVLEGDGSVGADRGSLMITSNLKDLEILEKVMRYTGFAFRKKKEGTNKGFIFIGSLEIIQNISILKDKLFIYYPKRRRILKERLAQTGCARFLLGKSNKTSNWLIGQLNNYGILDGNGNLTDFGKKIQKDLKEFLLSDNKGESYA